MLISDNQRKGLDIANFNILPLPEAELKHVYNFILEKDPNDIIILFIEGNNLFHVTSEDSVR